MIQLSANLEPDIGQVHGWVSVCATQCKRWLEANSVELVLSFHFSMSSED